MTRNYEVNTDQTLDTVNQLLDEGITKICALIRHSDRFYSTEPGMEPFMGLTDNGKKYAYDFGTRLRSAFPPKLYSSLMGRCVETAYLIDKGFAACHGSNLEHNRMDKTLFAFYIKDFEKAVRMFRSMNANTFLREWFDGKLDDTIMQDPQETVDTLVRFIDEQVRSLDGQQIGICVSHDWNIYPIKEFKMGLSLETSGSVGYLDGVVFFEKNGTTYLTSHQMDTPIPL